MKIKKTFNSSGFRSKKSEKVSTGWTEKWLGKFLTVFETETFSELSRINKFQGLADNLFLEADYFKGWLGFQTTCCQIRTINK